MKKIFVLLIVATFLGGCAGDRRNQARLSPAEPIVQQNIVATAARKLPVQTHAAADIIEPNGVLTLRDALRLTLVHNPELKASVSDIKAAQARHLQVGLWQNPELDIEVENFGGSGKFSGTDSAETTIQLSQLIEMGGKIQKRRQAFSYDTQLAEIQYDARRLDISMALTQSFIELLFIQEKQQLSQKLIDLSQAVVDSVDKRVRAGKDSPIDLSKAQIGLAKARMQDIEIRKYQPAVRDRLASFWASETAVFAAAVGRLDELDSLPELFEVQAFLKENPDVVAHGVEVQKRQVQMALAKAQSIPDIKIAGGVKHDNESDDTAFVVGLSIPLPVSDRNQGGRLEAMHNLQAAQTRQTVTTLSVRNDINRLYADVAAAYQRATILRDDVLAVSKELFNASKIAYEQGKKNYLELLDSQRTYFAAQNDYVDALAAYHLNKTELERLIGRNLRQLDTTDQED